jgi:surfeit locus 1 family protein
VKSILNARLIKLNIGRFRFSPAIWSTAFTLCLIYFMITMGLWQLSRAEYKDNLLDKIGERKNLKPVNVSELPHEVDDSLFLPVDVSGTFDTRHQFLYDNRIINGRVGYHVYTPLRLETGGSVLINRGWVPQGKTRQNLPEIPASLKTVKFTGLMDRVPSKGFILSENLHDEISWPMVLQYVDTKELERTLGYPLMSMVIWMDKDSEDVFQHELPVLLLDSSKNKGYTFQWFAMALALLIIYIVMNTKKIAKNKG